MAIIWKHVILLYFIIIILFNASRESRDRRENSCPPGKVYFHTMGLKISQGDEHTINVIKQIIASIIRSNYFQNNCLIFLSQKLIKLYINQILKKEKLTQKDNIYDICFVSVEKLLEPDVFFILVHVCRLVVLSGIMIFLRRINLHTCISITINKKCNFIPFIGKNITRYNRFRIVSECGPTVNV